MTGPDRRDRLEQGARREGGLLLYTTGTQIQPLMDRFTSKYPFIKLQLYRADSAQVTKKIMEEYRAGYYEADGFELAADALLLPRSAGILQPFSSPELAAYDAAALDPGRNWAPVRESYTGIAYNTKLIPPEQAPKVWADLAKPEFKGKIAMPGSTSSTAEWVGIQILANGEDFLRKLGQQDIRVYQITARAVANLVASGEVAILARASNAHIAADKAKGAPVAWVAPGPTAVTDTVVAITSKAKHPHAMMLMIDFLLSEEGQRMYMEIGYNSARKGLEDPDTPKQKVYFSTHPNYVEEFDHWAELWNKIFIKR
jgi:iron(III) transport system substrate-binding protein